jgi:choline dehydrogenase-like flavoprotein
MFFTAVKLAILLSSSQPFQHLGAKLHLPMLSECKHLEVDPQNLAYLECIIRTAAITGYHPGGTCKMGSPYDDTAVVDPLLRYVCASLYVDPESCIKA